MNLLAIETTTEACSIAAMSGDRLALRHDVVPRRHAELALPWCEEVLVELDLARTDLHAIAVSVGPGAFTGVRLGLGLAQGIALGLNLLLLPASTLHVLAAGAQAQPGQKVLAAIDARMGQVYWCAYQLDVDHQLNALCSEQLSNVGDTAEMIKTLLGADSFIGVGTGFAADNQLLATQLRAQLSDCQPQALPSAANLCRIAQARFEKNAGVRPELVEPAYLRNKVAQTIAERAQTSGS